ncbi:class I SAM-dependent methyltransferase [Halosimplex halobium]|uniref:class I SAM-dependent methyltransferase n=1 Tax=Halosimplex halobium TaxID=3396618 RepID=UPI003F554964
MTDPSTDRTAVKDLVRQHWNGRADTFDDEPHHGIHTDAQRDRWLAVLREWVGADPGRALDVGCGTGVVALLLADLGHEVVGVDAAPAMLAQARAKSRGTDRSLAVLQGDAESLPLADDSVELVTARHLVWTLPNPRAALREWQRVLEPGGRLLLIEGCWDHPEPWAEYEQVHDELPLYDGRPPEALRDILHDEGVRAIATESLMDPVLWGRDPRHEYYLMTGTLS